MTSHIYNAGWYADNEGRKYPLDSISTVSDDNSNILPNGILADVKLVYQSTLGAHCYLSGLTITDNLVTAVFSASDTNSTSPVASISLKQPIDPFYHYDLNPISDGVAGIIVFGGEALTARGTWLFSSYTQSGLSPDCYTRVPVFPVKSLGISNGTIPLTGAVGINAGSGIKIDLVEGSSGAYALWLGLDTTQGNAAEILKYYTGPCDTRVESDTCRRTSIERVGGAIPSCSGTINIVGEEGIIVTTAGNAIVLSYDKTLSDVCTPYTIGTYVGEKDCVNYTRYGDGSINTYSSDVHISTGGLEYGSELGVTNIDESGPCTATVNIPDEAVSISFTVAKNSETMADIHTFLITDGVTRYEVNASGIKVNGSLLYSSTFPYSFVITESGARINNNSITRDIDLQNISVTIQGCYLSDITYE